MASPSFLGSSTSSFHGQFHSVHVQAPLLSARIPRVSLRNGSGVVSVKATAAHVLVEKSESEKVNRLKTTYLEKIVPLLMEEFSYKNIQEVNPAILMYISYYLDVQRVNGVLWVLSLELFFFFNDVIVVVW